jgi:hypothetical protein
LIPPDIGARLLCATDRAIHRIGRFAPRFANSRCKALIEHAVMARIGRPVFGHGLGL